MRSSFDFQVVPTLSIDCPDGFVRWLHQGPADARTADILQQFGQTVPLLVWQQPSARSILLSGYPIFQAIQELGFEQAHCLVLPPDTSSLHRYSLWVLHDLAALQASPILQAHLLRQARQNLNDEDLFSLLSLMGHKPHRAKLEALDALLDLCPATILACHRGLLSTRSVGLMHRLSPVDQEMATQLIEQYRPGGSKQFKLVEMITELVFREGTTVQELVGEWLTDTKQAACNGPQQIQGLLQTLSARCWPEKNRLEKQFQQFVRQLQLPEGVAIVPSPSFEDDSVEMRLRFADADQFLARWDLLKTRLSR